MKLSLIPLLMSCILAHVTAAESATYENAISNTKADPSRQNVIDLGGHLRGAARYNSNSATNSYFKKIQETLLAIPGHAQYFADEIKREQQKVASYPTTTGPRVSYDFHRSLYFETLSLLPSPETISVLGDFLSDDIDTPVPLRSPDSDWGDNPRANSFSASCTFMKIGLRNPPMAKGTYDADPDAHLAKTRAWWEKVKSGELTFSFLGQKVEYRIKPDGTWDTIALANPPDDAPKPATVTERPEKRLPSQGAKAISPSESSWPWIIGVVVAVLSGLGWLVLKKSSPRAE